jgi:hypothetical protein
MFSFYQNNLTEFKNISRVEESYKKDIEFFKSAISELTQALSALKVAKSIKNLEEEEQAWSNLVIACI